LVNFFLYLSPGVGGSAGAAIFGELARTTTQKKRTRAFSVFMSMKLIGITIGRLQFSVD